jgi:hypothetical protein
MKKLHEQGDDPTTYTNVGLHPTQPSIDKAIYLRIDSPILQEVQELGKEELRYGSSKHQNACGSRGNA